MSDDATGGNRVEERFTGKSVAGKKSVTVETDKSGRKRIPKDEAQEAEETVMGATMVDDAKHEKGPLAGRFDTGDLEERYFAAEAGLSEAKRAQVGSTVYLLLVGVIDDSLARFYMGLSGRPRELWTALCSEFERATVKSRLSLQREFNLLRMKSKETVAEFCARIDQGCMNVSDNVVASPKTL